MINFICSACGAALHIGDEWAGKLGRCPHCGANTRLPGNPRRTSKLVILFRIGCIPLAIVVFWGMMLSIADAELGWKFILYGVVAFAVVMLFLWVVTNLFTFLTCPREYRLWKKGGGDPFFDTVSSPLNNDAPSVRYQELYREKARQECEQLGIPIQAPPRPSDSTKGIDDPNVI